MVAFLEKIGRLSASTFWAVMPARPATDDYSKELTDDQIKLMHKLADEERASWVSIKRAS